MIWGTLKRPTRLAGWGPIEFILVGWFAIGSLVAGVAGARETQDENTSDVNTASSMESPAEDAGTDEKPLDNRLKWSTASEVDNFGYHIYRADTEDGPFERLTEDPMPGAGTTDEPSYYEFIDDAIDPTRDYYYYVESLAMDGTRERFTPVIRAKAKTPGVEDVEGTEDSEPSGTESVAPDGSESSESESDPPSQAEDNSTES
ncbi:MAG: hypothetical protein K8J08_18185 [Thermoanaerobaculia bacterium]|nr:hypothetical protein [Thermoanaerobaculia bacterium]